MVASMPQIGYSRKAKYDTLGKKRPGEQALPKLASSK
jgi:hypothetical protein